MGEHRQRIGPEGFFSKLEQSHKDFEKQEGISPEVKKLRKEHQLPDSDIEFEELARYLAVRDLGEAHLAPKSDLATRGERIKEAAEHAAQEDQRLERQVVEHMKVESFDTLARSVGQLVQTIDRAVELIRKKISQSSQPGQKQLEELSYLHRQAKDAILPIANIDQRLGPDVSTVQVYEVYYRSRIQLHEIADALQSITKTLQ